MLACGRRSPAAKFGAAAGGIPLRPAKDSRAIPGKAVEAVVTGKRVAVGSLSFAAEQALLLVSITKGWPRRHCTCSATSLVITSSEPPGDRRRAAFTPDRRSGSGAASADP
jgi:hypothetical protein